MIAWTTLRGNLDYLSNTYLRQNTKNVAQALVFPLHVIDTVSTFILELSFRPVAPSLLGSWESWKQSRTWEKEKQTCTEGNGTNEPLGNWGASGGAMKVASHPLHNPYQDQTTCNFTAPTMPIVIFLLQSSISPECISRSDPAS